MTISSFPSFSVQIPHQNNANAVPSPLFFSEGKVGPTQGQHLSAQQKIYTFLQESGYLNPEGKWIHPSSPCLPRFESEQEQRLHQLLNTPHKVNWRLCNGHNFKGTITLKEIIQLLQLDEFELVGGGVPWLLGGDYFRRFLQTLAVPDALMPVDLFAHFDGVPQDFDFRIHVPQLYDDQMYLPTDCFFDSLAFFFNLTPADVKRNFTKKRYSRAGEPDKYAMATLKFNDTTGNNCDFDFIFVKSLRRNHLNTGDDLRIQIKTIYTDWSAIRTFLQSDVCTRRALVDNLTGTIDAYAPETINSKGFVTTLVRTIKGRHPLKPDFFRNLYSLAQPQIPDDSTYTKHLFEVIRTHFKDHPFALFAATINAHTFLGEVNNPFSFNVIPPHYFQGTSFLEQVFRLVANPDVGYPLTMSVILIHAHLGWGSSIEIFKEDGDDTAEIRIHLHGWYYPLSVFIKDSFETALTRVASLSLWDSLAPIAQIWLTQAPLTGLPLPATAPEAIALLRLNPQAYAQTLAFVLSLKWHIQHPSDPNIEQLFFHLSSLFPAAPYSCLASCCTKLFDMLDSHPRYNLGGSSSPIREKILALCLNPEASHREFAAILFGSEKPELQRMALKILCKRDSSEADQRTAISLLQFSFQGKALGPLSLFLEFLPLIDLRIALETFTNILESHITPNTYKAHKKQISDFLTRIEKGDPHLSANLVNRVLQALKKIDPSRASNLAASVKKNPHFLVTSLIALKETTEQSNDLQGCKDAFLKQLHHRKNKECENILQEIFNGIFKKFAENAPQNHPAFLRLLTNPEVFSLLESNVHLLIDYYVKLSDTIQTSHDNQKLIVCEALSKALALQNLDADTYRAGAGLLSSLLTTLQGSPPCQHKSQKPPLFSNIKPILLKLNLYNIDDIFLQLLEFCYFVGFQISFDSPSSLAIAQKLLQLVSQSNPLQLPLLEHACSAIKTSLKGQIKNECTEKFALAFVEIYLRFNQPKKAKEWLIQLKSSSVFSAETAEKLQSQKLFNDVEDLLSAKYEHLFEPAELKKAWLHLIESFMQENIEKAGRLCLSQKKLLSEPPILKEIQTTLQTTITRLCQQPSASSRDMALQLFSAYKLTSADLWNLVFQSNREQLNKPRVLSLWNSLENLPDKKDEIAGKKAIMLFFGKFNISKPALLAYLSPGMFEQSLYYVGTPEEIRKTAALLLENACECIRSNPECSLTFDAFIGFKNMYVKQSPEGACIQFWLEHAHPKKHLACLKYLQTSTSSKHDIPIMFSHELRKAISNAITPPHDLELYRYFLLVLASSKLKLMYSDKELESDFSKLLPIILQEATTGQDLTLAVNALHCIVLHQASLFRTDSKKRVFLPLVFKFLPLIITGASVDENHIELFCKYHQMIIDPLFSCSRPTSNAQNALEWELRHLLINTLLESSITTQEAQKIILSIIDIHLENLIELPQANSTGKDELIKTIDKLLFSSLFTPSRELDTIEVEHLAICKKLVNQATKKNVLDTFPQLQLEYEAFFLTRISYDETFTYAQHGMAVIRTIYRLLTSPTSTKLTRAYILFNNSQEYLKTLPEKTIPCFSLLLEYMWNITEKNNYRITWMEGCCLPFLLNIIAENTYKKLPIQNAEKTYDKWIAEAPNLFLKFMKALGKIACDKRLYNCSNALSEDVYNLAHICFSSILNNQSVTLSTIQLYEMFLQYIRIAISYAHDQDVKESLNSEMIFCLQQTILNAASTPLNSTKPSFQLSLKLLQSELHSHEIRLKHRLNALFILTEVIIELDQVGIFAANSRLYEETAYQHSLLLKEHFPNMHLESEDVFNFEDTSKAITPQRKQLQIEWLYKILAFARKNSHLIE